MLRLRGEIQLTSGATEENAVNLVYVFIGLQDSYELDNFSTKRQGIVTALIACCPKKTAPYVQLAMLIVTRETDSPVQLHH